MLIITCSVNAAQYPESSFAMSPRSATMPLYFWYWGSSSDFLRRHRSINDAKWIVWPALHASSITNLFLVSDFRQLPCWIFHYFPLFPLHLFIFWRLKHRSEFLHKFAWLCASSCSECVPQTRPFFSTQKIEKKGVTHSKLAETTSCDGNRHPHLMWWAWVEYTFIQNRFHPLTLSSKHGFIQWHFHPMTLSSKTLSSNNNFIQWISHPMTLSTKNGFIQNITCGTINIVRVCVKASPAEGPAMLHMKTCWRSKGGCLGV